MNAIRCSTEIERPTPRQSESSRMSGSEHLVRIAFDPESPLSFFERIGLVLWIGGNGRDGFGGW